MTLSALRAAKCRGFSEKKHLQNESRRLLMISFCKQGGSSGRCALGDAAHVPEASSAKQGRGRVGGIRGRLQCSWARFGGLIEDGSTAPARGPLGGSGAAARRSAPGGAVILSPGSSGLCVMTKAMLAGMIL